MLNALRVLGRDLLRLVKAPAALVVVVALIVLPSTYTWFNVVGFWDPYGNTGNMRVCVVNEDAGGDNELMGSMNLGNQIVDTLKENTQLKWDFMSYDEAMEEVNSGRAYAAFVIPSDFTSNLFTILSGDFQQPNLQYYVNEKVNPVSPKVTDAGSSTLDSTINSEFVSTVSEVVAEKLDEKITEVESDLNGAQSDAVTQLDRANNAVSQTRSKVSELTSSARDAQGKASSAKSSLNQVRDDVSNVEDQLQQVSDLSGTMQTSIMNFTAIAMPGMSNANLALSQAAANATNSVTSAATAINKAEGTVDASLERVQGVIDVNESIIAQLQSVYDSMPDSSSSDNSGSSSSSGSFSSSSKSSSKSSSWRSIFSKSKSSSSSDSTGNTDGSTSGSGSSSSGSGSSSGSSGSSGGSSGSSSGSSSSGSIDYSKLKPQLKQAIEDLTDRNARLQRSLESFKQLSQDVTASADAVSSAATALNVAAQNSIGTAGTLQSQLFGTSLPQVSNGLSQVSIAAVNLKAAVSNQSYLVDETSNIVDQLNSTLGSAIDSLGQTDTVLASLQDSVSKARTDITLLSTSSTLSDFIESGHIDATKIAEFMQSPTKVTTEKLYPLNSYGTAMAPLFISLSLWVGTIMLAVILKLEVDKEGIPGLTVVQGYIGRWLLFALLVIAQAVVCVAGCLALGVEVASVPAFYATAICMSLAYLCITYTLSSSLQHIGIGLCIILVFVQIPGGTGLYPVEMTDSFFRAVYPLFPFTYGINALRESIGGFYQDQYLFYMGVLALISLTMMIIGLFVRPHLTNLNRLVAKEIQKSDVLNVEAALVPERRYRIGQLIRALSDHDEFHETMKSQADRFMKVYPILKRVALVAGILVPIIFTAVFAVTMTAKVVILTAWLIWLVVVIAFLVVMEFIRDNIERQASIDGMSDDELRRHLGIRGRKTLKQLVPAAVSGSRITVPLPQIVKLGDPGVSDSSEESESETTQETGEFAAVNLDEGAEDFGAWLDAQDGEVEGSQESAQSAVSSDRADGADEGSSSRTLDAAARKAKTSGDSLLDLAAQDKPAVFEGPAAALSHAADEEDSENEELLVVERPQCNVDVAPLTAIDLRNLRRRRRRARRAVELRAAASTFGDVAAPADEASSQPDAPSMVEGDAKSKRLSSSDKKKAKKAKKAAAQSDKAVSADGSDKADKRDKKAKADAKKARKRDKKKQSKKGQEGNRA